MKSLLVSVFWPAWEWGARGLASTRYVAASHSQEFAIRDTLKMRRLVSSEWYQERWPVALTKDQNEKTKFENASTGFRQAMAMASLTGTRGDRVIIDDPHSIEGAISDADRARTLRVFTETVPSRLSNPDRSAIVVVMQRIHEQDVSGFILSDADNHGYVHLCLPMEFEPERRCVTPYFTDPRTYDGELLFPERFPPDVIKRDKAIMGSHAVAGQFQQRPAARGGGLIRGAYFNRYDVLPAIKYRRIYADTAMKTDERHDYSVFQCWGFGQDGKIYLIDQVRGKWESPELKRKAVDFWRKHKALDEKQGALQRMVVEDKASGTGLIQDIKRDNSIPIFGVQRSKDKYARVSDILGYIESGYVSLPVDSPFICDFVAECEAFTADDSHAHDDQIDPMCDAITEMLQSNSLRAWENMI
jgi:predicted phage terminase large subunit-like protein